MEYPTCDYCNNKLNKHKHPACDHVFCNFKCAGAYRASKSYQKETCNWCKKSFEKLKSAKRGEHTFCGLKCRDAFVLNKYNFLLPSFLDNPNESAYLLGLIMGDGHLKKAAKYTTRVSIAFNALDSKSINITSKVLNKLGINFFMEPKIHTNCQMLGFVLPDDLLKHFGILFHGCKFKAQPVLPDFIVENINFSIGLLNSDGCKTKPKKRKEYISFCNTVDSIMEAHKKCLRENGINFKEYEYTYKNKNWRKRMSLYITEDESISEIMSQKYCKWHSS